MIMGPTNTCPKCEKEAATFWAPKQKVFMCAACQRLYNPPYMTLIRFNQGSYNRLWNLEVGAYEMFSEIEGIEWCGWFVRSEQETLYKLMPRVVATVYHMEFFGDVGCGRCVNYPYFEPDDKCMAEACKKVAKPFKPTKDIEYPPERSRYTTWMKIKNQ